MFRGSTPNRELIWTTQSAVQIETLWTKRLLLISSNKTVIIPNVPLLITLKIFIMPIPRSIILIISYHLPGFSNPKNGTTTY
jgi:hypothetical protein